MCDHSKMTDLDRLAELNKQISNIVIDSEMFSQIIDSLPEGLIVIDEKGIIHHVNQQITLIFGYVKTLLVSKPVHILLAPELHEIHDRHIEKFFSHPTVRPMNSSKTLAGRHRNGRVVNVKISIGPLISEQIDGMLGLALVRRASDGE